MSKRQGYLVRWHSSTHSTGACSVQAASQAKAADVSVISQQACTDTVCTEAMSSLCRQHA